MAGIGKDDLVQVWSLEYLWTDDCYLVMAGVGKDDLVQVWGLEEVQVPSRLQNYQKNCHCLQDCLVIVQKRHS